MNILIIGGGGREYGIAKRLSEDPRVEKLWVLPGNGGMREFAECVDIKATDLDGVCGFVRENPVDFAVVTPDDPLALGMADRLRELGVKCFGPSKAAARIEASKIFSKELMKKYGIPTAKAESFNSKAFAMLYLSKASFPVVIKADGLALGKGVFICHNHHEATEALKELMENKLFGASGERVLIEEYLEGPEVSVLSFTDGKTIVPMVSSMDHKTAFDSGKGPNTGGMGIIAPNPFYTEAVAEECMEKIFLPTIRAMEKEGCPFSGCLYFGLMLTKDGPKVIEYNCRFGDPECQTVLPLMESNLLDVMLAVEEGRLAETEVKFNNRFSCCVVLASGGYPGKYEKGKRISIGIPSRDTEIVHAGTKLENGGFVTAGGRVLNVIAQADTLEDAVKNAYEETKKVSFEGMYMRNDIGKTALAYVKSGKTAFDCLRKG